MDTAIFEKLGLHQTLGWDDEINGHRNTDLVGQMISPGDAGYHPCAEAFPDTDVPRGAMTELLDWSESTVFPGVKRNIYFYKPDQLDRATEAPGLMVFLDGPAHLAPAGPIRAAAVLDTLNHRGEIPVTAAVFVTPGRPLDQPSVHEEPPAVLSPTALPSRNAALSTIDSPMNSRGSSPTSCYRSLRRPLAFSRTPSPPGGRSVASAPAG